MPNSVDAVRDYARYDKLLNGRFKLRMIRLKLLHFFILNITIHDCHLSNLRSYHPHLYYSPSVTLATLAFQS